MSRGRYGPRRLAAARGLYYLALILAVLPLGAADRPTLGLSVASVALAALVSAFIPLRDARLERLRWAAMAILLALILYIVFQCLRFPGNPFANPIWRTVGDQLGARSGSISVAPSESLYALGGLASPFLIFVAGLALFQGDDAAWSLWRLLAVGAGLLAVFSLIQFLAFPSWLLIFPKVYYLDSLTAVFVNRNTAATFLGITALLLFGCIIRVLDHGGRVSAGGLLAPWRLGTRARRDFWIYGGLCAATIVALLLTRSRGGVAATVVGFVTAAAIMDATAARPPADKNVGSDRRRSGFKPLMALAAIVVVVLVFGGQTILRLQTQGLDNARFCILPGVFAAIRDNWLWGSGFATFGQIFPMYRDPACGIDGSWLRAHDSFLEGYLGLGVLFIPAALLIYFLLISVLTHGIRNRRQNRFAPIAALAVLVLATAHSLIDFSMQIQGVRIVFAAAMAAGVTLSFHPMRLQSPAVGVGREARDSVPLARQRSAL
jgi:hypothetical protein